MIGSEVFTIGNPQHLDWTHTRGSISQLRLQHRGLRQVHVIQTDAPLNPGNSGGGLYDKSGTLIGINTWTNDKRFSEGLGFAIALDTLLELDPPGVHAEKEAPAKEEDEQTHRIGFTVMSTVRLRRLQADYEKLRAFLAQQPRIRLIQAQGTPPERYQLEFQIKGLREVDEQLQTVANHIVEISLPLSYPRLPPQCRMLTPVFHPNIAPHAICIGDHWAAGEPLWSMVARIGEMIAYQSYNTKSPLNGEAARWVEANQDKLPLDRTNFVMDDRLPEPADHG